MIVKSGLWGSVPVLGGAVICATALAGWGLVQMLRSVTPESLRPPENVASLSRLEAAPRSSLNEIALEASVPTGALSELLVDVARIMPNGDVLVAGRTEPGARVALLDNGETLLEAQADPATGEFVILPRRLGTGAHSLSLRSVSSDRSLTKESFVQAFSVAPEAKASVPGIGASSGNATIVRGDTLWRISRERLGRGALYPTIYQANSTMISNPNLIYPGHTLTIP